ncbi:MAG: DUF2851 family protein [Candidatus Stahlbacteria bacterium]|nr:DUF2851 family protein [Candidatus Stahlbacteria bacterium]
MKREVPPVSLNERLLQWVWQNQLLVQSIVTESGIKIKPLSPGILNTEDGPDFRNAKIESPNNILYGDIELHILSKDWFAHTHHLDPKYNNVILHIVWQHNSTDAVTWDLQKIPTLIISKYIVKPMAEIFTQYKKATKPKKYPCAKNHSKVMTILKTEGIKRFNEKKEKFNKLITLYGVEQATYLGVMEALGYVKNKIPFTRLANLVPIDKLQTITSGKQREERVQLIKSILLEVAGLILYEKSFSLPLKSGSAGSLDPAKSQFIGTMKKEEWQFFKVRPPSFPNRRIEGISYFLADTIEKGIWNLFKEEGFDFDKLENSLTQGGISKPCAKMIIFNIYLPILGLYREKQALQIYETYKRLPENTITKRMTKLLFKNHKRLDEVLPQNELYSQGMLYIFHHYCKNKLCSACPAKGITSSMGKSTSQ